MDLYDTGLLDINNYRVEGTAPDTFPVSQLIIAPQQVAPSLDLNFAAVKALDSRITFTRASVGTYVNSSGLVTTASSGNARFTHDPVTLRSLGLLIEESRVNSLVRSEEFNDVTWSKNANTVSTNYATAPDGNTTADRIVPTAVSGSHNILQSVSKAASSIAYTVSLFAKADGYSFVGFRLDDGGANGAYACFDVSNGTVSTAATTTGTGFSSASAAVTAYQSGWYLISLSFTSNTATSVRAIFTVQDATGNPFTYSFTGNGTSGVLLWGAQLEAGAFGTSYIPTTSATVTRSADVVQMTSTNFSAWYKQDNGTFAVEFTTPIRSSSDRRLLSVGPGSASIDLIHQTGGNISIDNTTVASLLATSNSTVVGATAKAAGNFVPGSYAVCLNGGTVATATSSNSISATSLTIGAYVSSSAYINTPIARVRYYPKSLTNANLKALTV